MDPNKRLLFAAVMLLIVIGNFTRMTETETVRTVTFLHIFAIGALSAIVIRELLGKIWNKK